MIRKACSHQGTPLSALSAISDTACSCRTLLTFTPHQAAVKPSIAPFESLCVNEFVNDATRLAVQVQATLDRAPIRVAPDHIRDTDEHEFYLPGVAKVLAEVLTSCEHMQHIPAMLASDRESPATKLDTSSTTSSAASSGSGAPSTAYRNCLTPSFIFSATLATVVGT